MTLQTYTIRDRLPPRHQWATVRATRTELS